MTETRTTFWDRVQQALKAFPEEGALTRSEVAVWARWHLGIVNQMEATGWQYRGMTLKYQGWKSLLVVKATHEGTPYVAFITERDTTACMRAYMRMFDQDRVKWKKDQFG